MKESQGFLICVHIEDKEARFKGFVLNRTRGVGYL